MTTDPSASVPQRARFAMTVTGYALTLGEHPISQAGWYDLNSAADGNGQNWSVPTFAVDENSIQPAPAERLTTEDMSEIAGILSARLGAQRAEAVLGRVLHAVDASTIPWSVARGEHPGAILQGRLDQLGMSQVELCRRSGLSTKHVNQIIKGAIGVSADIALVFERELGIPAMTWNHLDAAWRDTQARARAAIGGEGR